MHHLYRHWEYRGKLLEQEKKDVANYKNGFIHILGNALDDHDLMVALSVFDIILADLDLIRFTIIRHYQNVVRRVWRWCRRSRKAGRACVN